MILLSHLEHVLVTSFCCTLWIGLYALNEKSTSPVLKEWLPVADNHPALPWLVVASQTFVIVPVAEGVPVPSSVSKTEIIPVSRHSDSG